MRSGLDGRYGKGLQMWNTARELSSRLIASFYGSNDSIRDVLGEYQINFPSLSQVKKAINEVVFHSGRSKIDVLAKSIMRWEGWSVPFGKDARSGASA